MILRIYLDVNDVTIIAINHINNCKKIYIYFMSKMSTFYIHCINCHF